MIQTECNTVLGYRHSPTQYLGYRPSAAQYLGIAYKHNTIVYRTSAILLQAYCNSIFRIHDTDILQYNIQDTGILKYNILNKCILIHIFKNTVILQHNIQDTRYRHTAIQYSEYRHTEIQYTDVDVIVESALLNLTCTVPKGKYTSLIMSLKHGAMLA